MEPLIRQKADWQTATNAEILAFFQETTSTPIPTKYTVGAATDKLYADLVAEGVLPADALTRANANIRRLVKALFAAAKTDEMLDILYRQFANPGIDFHTTERQTMLSSFATANTWPNGSLFQLIRLGVRTSTRWADAQGPVPLPLPTLAEIGAVVKAMKELDGKLATRKWLDEEYMPAIHAALNAGKTKEQIEGKTIAQLIA